MEPQLLAYSSGQTRRNAYKKYDLYLVLELDEEAIREKGPEEQDKKIRKAFRRLMRRYRPDRNRRNLPRVQNLTAAYNILKNRENRAAYHMLSNAGKCIKSRLREIFFPRDCTAKEKRKRRCLFVGCCILTLAGLGICIGTGGLGLPIALGCGALAGACSGAGFHGAKSILSSIDGVYNNELDMGKFLKSFLIGGVFGAVGGLLTAGIGLAIGDALAFGLPEISFLEDAIAAAPVDFVNGSIYSIASDAIKRVVDKKDVTFGEIVLNAIKGGFTGMLLSGNLHHYIGRLADPIKQRITKADFSYVNICRDFLEGIIKFTRGIIKTDAYVESDTETDNNSK